MAIEPVILFLKRHLDDKVQWILGFLLLIAIILVVLRWIEERGRFAGSPPIVRTWIPYFGGALFFSRDPVGCLKWAQSKYGNCFTLNLISWNATFDLNVKDQVDFFELAQDELSLDESFADHTRGFLGDLFATENYSKYAGGMIKEGFKVSEKINQYIAGIATAKADEILDELATSGAPFSLFDVCSKYIMDVNLITMLGHKAQKEYGEEFAEAYYDIERVGAEFSTIIFQSVTPFSSSARTTKEAKKRIMNILKKVIEEREAEGAEEYDDYLSTWLTKELPNGEKFIPRDIFAHFISLLFAGHTSSADSMAWTMTRIMAEENKKYLEKCQEEQAESIRENGEQLTIDVVENWPYLDSCLREATRLIFPVLMFRKVKKHGLVFGQDKWQFPENEMLCCAPIINHLSDEVYENATTYNPDRWSEDSREGHLKNRSFVLFGHGRHRCFGERYALAMERTFIATVLRKYNMVLENQEIPNADLSKALGVPYPERPVMVRVTKKEEE